MTFLVQPDSSMWTKRRTAKWSREWNEASEWFGLWGGQDAGTKEAALGRKLPRVNAERSDADLFISYWVK
jgi:hypothetical protein